MGKLYINWTLGILQEIQMEIDANNIPFTALLLRCGSKAEEGGGRSPIDLIFALTVVQFLPSTTHLTTHHRPTKLTETKADLTN